MDVMTHCEISRMLLRICAVQVKLLMRSLFFIFCEHLSGALPIINAEEKFTPHLATLNVPAHPRVTERDGGGAYLGRATTDFRHR